MKRSEFDKLNQLEQIDFVNKQLKQGTSLTQICKDIDIARSTLRKRFEKTGYTFNKEHNKYELAVATKIVRFTSNLCKGSGTLQKLDCSFCCYRPLHSEFRQSLLY
ncbi:DUF4250 family protein [Clostridium tepidiprofundi]|nr:DUF4250 family protein [Clostridium tepidiprofundi]